MKIAIDRPLNCKMLEIDSTDIVQKFESPDIRSKLNKCRS
jgi:hypothetical protein